MQRRNPQVGAGRGYGELPVLADDAARWALFLDVDGTLLDIAPAPEKVVVEPSLPTTLAMLAQHLGGALALISGRSIVQLDALFRPARLPIAGLHGAQWRDASGCIRQVTVDRQLMQQVRRAAADLAQRYPGVHVEDKGLAIALHWRGAPAAEHPLREAVDTIAGHSGLVVQPGKCVFELKPAGVDKGAALRQLLATPPFHGRLPLFIGDDLTDGPALAAAQAAGGLGVAVGDVLAAGADVALPLPATVRAWLQQCRDDLGQRPPARPAMEK